MAKSIPAESKDRRLSGIIALTIVAPCLGGAVAVWAQGVLAIGAGLLMLLFPPRRSLGPGANILFAALIAIALTAFLPATWFALPDWRLALIKLGADLPSTRSPQPWLSLQWSCFLLLVLSWGYYLATVRWDRRSRQAALIAYAFAILVLSAGLIFGFVTKLRIPFWPAVQEFGFFPNRNQTSNVLGLGAIVIYALGLQRLQEGNRYWWLWIASLSLVCWALIIDASRAGIVLFFFGALAVHLYWWSTSRDHRQTLVALGGLVLVVILFVIDGGATLARFTKESAGFFEIARNLRFAIYRDAIQLILKSSPFGIGLGNFWPVFAIHRHYSFNTSQTAHPESDWVWGAIDLGWLGFLIALAIFCWWIFHCLPFRAGTNRVLRVAAMVCTIAFAVHGLLDVSGHRLGALLPALFLAAVAINPQIEFRRSPLVAIVFRVVGLVLLFVGVCWSTSVRQDIIPSTVRVERSLKRVDQAVDAKRYGEAVTESSHALAIAPLEWIFYFRRGVGEAATFQSQSLVRRDFAIACYLLPNWPELYLKEGEVWLGIGDPDEAVQIWEEGMRRFPENATALYSDMFGAVRSDPDLRERWRQLADDNKDRVLAFLAVADQTEFELELQQLLAADDQLRAFDVNRLKRLFALWFQKGDKLWLADILRQHPDWQKIAWPQLARAFAEYQDYRQAFETASNFLPAPEPPNSGGETDSQPRSGFQTNSDYATAGLAVVFAQSREGKTDDALTSLLAVKALPTAPKNVAVLEARLWAQKKEWKRAWQAIEPLVPAL